MICRSPRWLPFVICGVLGLPFEATNALAASPAAAEVPDYYLGVGVRGAKRDATAFVVDSKVKLLDVGAATLSTRPALLFGGYDFEWRLPVTLDFETDNHRFGWFAGAGLAYNMDDLGDTDAMVTGGVDFALNHRLILNLTLNYIWQSSISDDDTEFMASLNYGF